MALKTTGKKEAAPFVLATLNPDKADKTGFLHGVRAIMKEVRAIYYNYANKDGVAATHDDGSEVQAPGIMVTYAIKGGEDNKQFYANGREGERSVHPKGKGFGIPAGSPARAGLSEGSNAFMLIASLKSAGWPSDKFSGDLTVFEGTEVDLIAQPIGQSKRAKAEGERARTIAVVGNIVKFPAGVQDEEAEDEPEAEEEEADDEEDEAPAKPAKKAKPAPADDEDEDEEEEEEEEAEEAEDDEADEDPLVAQAQQYVADVLTSKKYRGKSITLDALSAEVLALAKANKNRNKIIALVQDPAFHKDAPWTYDKKSKSISADE